MSLRWLSFAGEEGFRGAFLTRADSDLLAHAECTLLGCNPGGECLFLEIPDDLAAAGLPGRFLRRLLSKWECAELDRAMGGDGTVVRASDGREEKPSPPS